ncbi:MAG: glycosyl transferase family 2 [Marivirga sp.]|nr:glycosyl transferase family 2 [Marivirga sp.]
MTGSYITFSILNGLFLLFAIAISVSYALLAIVSLYELRRYVSRARISDYKSILASPLAPGISLLAPAYNESLTIIDNVKSLLSIMYNNLEVIIINDGSKDDTLKKLIEAFSLVKVPCHVKYEIKTKNVVGVYKSKNRAFKKLTVVDKQNGGKADALNVGINISTKPLVACIDVDCIIERDALLKMVKPFMEETSTVIASGGVVRIANSCLVEEGRLLEVRLPEKQVVRYQTLEYIRAFLIGRMAWSRLNGLLLISGAFGLFDKTVAIKAGGYNHKTVGEDMELVVRMRIYMQKQNKPYKVVYIPEPLCWTEAPSDYSVLGKQRNRWTRGTMETLKLHRSLFFNPKFGLMGMLSYPFWFFFEWLAPLIEFAGIIFFMIQLAMGEVNYLLAITLSLSVYTFTFMISMTALLAEELSYFQYKRKRDIAKLIITALKEPIFFHPRVVWWSIMGNIDMLMGKKSWGEMTRQGFTQYKKSSPVRL